LAAGPAAVGARRDYYYSLDGEGGREMRINSTISAIAVAVALVANPVAALATGKASTAIMPSSTTTQQTLSALEVENLMYMREEEKLARDVYLSMFDLWGLGVFENIAASEQTHTDSVKAMIEKYRLADPVVDDTIGVFVNQELATLYATLTSRGMQSSVEALHVGALIEEVDMVDLKRAIEETDNADIRQLYENLMSGSRNHLRAFVGQIEALGLVYEAQFLSQDEVDDIVDSPMERGRR